MSTDGVTAREVPSSQEEASAPGQEGIVREIGHDDFDPVGTAALIAIYFAILVGMWIFMYFVEFLGNGPTVIG